jgi:PAS domain S-box-containing protein
LTRGAVLLASAAALALAAGAVAIVVTSDHEPHKAATIALALPVGLSFVASGLIALRRRPANRTGLYLAAVGYLWFLAALGDARSDVVYTAGVLLSNLAFVPFAALVLAFPTGRLAPRPDRLLVRATAAFVALGPPLLLLFARRPPGCGSDCGDSAIVVHRSHTLEQIANVVVTAAGIALIVAIGVVLVRRWLRASAALRRTLGPVYLAGIATLGALLLGNVLDTFSQTASEAVSPIFLVFFTCVPIAFLLGILRSKLAHASVGRLVLEVGQGMPLREAIAGALGDPSLELAYLVEDGRLVDRTGRRVDLPPPGSGRTATPVEHAGRAVGVLVHDDSLAEEPELVESVAAAVALALDNERLEAQARVHYERLSTIVATAPSLLVIVDPDGRVVELNRAALRATGLEQEADVVGRPFWDVFIGAAERDAMIARFEAAAPEFAPGEYENVFTNVRGEDLVIAWQSAPLRDESGQVVAVVAGGLDITDRKRQERELRASRSRLVAAADDERRRLERNLHDGAQQRLVSLSLALRRAQVKLTTDAAETERILAEAADELALALEELRELARGIHPAVLTDRGLTAALEALAARTPLQVDLRPLQPPLPDRVEAAAYYVVSESIANVVKHAHASEARVRLSADNGSLRVEVEDDGVGGADLERGSGLRGLRDRVAALEGELRVETRDDGGTRVVAAIPLEGAAG